MEREIQSTGADDRNPVLRWTLVGDAVAVLATGLVMFAIAGRLSDWLDLPVDLLRWPGLFLIVYALGVGWYSTRTVYARRPIAGLIAVNLAWAIGCVILLIGGAIDPNGFGVGFILLNAAACLPVAALELVSLPA